jgi:hypothetical protein
LQAKSFLENKEGGRFQVYVFSRKKEKPEGLSQNLRRRKDPCRFYEKGEAKCWRLERGKKGRKEWRGFPLRKPRRGRGLRS